MLLVSVTNFTVWFAITFWVFLETKSVLATGVVAGIFRVATVLSGSGFGSLVAVFFGSDRWDRANELVGRRPA